MKKLVGIEIVPNETIQFTRDEEHICTTVNLAYKTSFMGHMKFEKAIPAGRYRTNEKRFEFFFFVDTLGNSYDEKTCKQITAFLETARIQGKLKIPKD